MYPIEKLQRTHEHLRTQLVTLESALSLGPDAWFVLRNTGFSLSKQLREHIGLEDRVVTACSRAFAHYGETVLASFALDHRQERQRLRQLCRVLEEDPRGSWHDLRATLNAFGHTLRQTMDLQEAKLFPLLERTEAPPAASNNRAHAMPNLLTETTTLAEVLRRYPDIRAMLERYGIRLSFEQYDALDEIAWHHGMSSQELLRCLEDAITKRTGARPSLKEEAGVTEPRCV